MKFFTPEQLSAWTGLGTFIGLICVGIMNQLSDRRRKIEAEERKREAEEASKKREEALAVNKATHTLVNSNMGAQLLLTSVALDRVAVYEQGKPGEQAALAAAKEAKRLYNEHVKKQAVVDLSPPPPQ